MTAYREPHEPFVEDPESVVRRVLAACRSSAQAGAKALWDSSSERLRRAAGDERHLARLLGNELFGPLVRGGEVRLEPVERIADSARQQVSLREEGSTARFLFSLKLTSEGDEGSRWLISGVERDA